MCITFPWHLALATSYIRAFIRFALITISVLAGLEEPLLCIVSNYFLVKYAMKFGLSMDVQGNVFSLYIIENLLPSLIFITNFPFVFISDKVIRISSLQTLPLYFKVWSKLNYKFRLSRRYLKPNFKLIFC